MYCCVKPAALLAVVGVIWMDIRAAAVTLSVALLELTPPIWAVMVVEPTAKVVAKPVLLTVALDVSLDPQVTEELMS